MKILKTALEDVLVIEFENESDVRGEKYLRYSKREYKKYGINFDYVEEKEYCPKLAGTLYGIHFQNNPKPQAKMLFCTEGRGYDYALDLRKNSPTYLKWVFVELSKENRRQIYIPKGFGHIFLSLEDNTNVVMRIDEYFDKNYSRQIAWNDQTIGIEYPVTNPILAQHDISAPKLIDSDINL